MLAPEPCPSLWMKPYPYLSQRLELERPCLSLRTKPYPYLSQELELELKLK